MECFKLYAAALLLGFGIYTTDISHQHHNHHHHNHSTQYSSCCQQTHTAAVSPQFHQCIIVFKYQQHYNFNYLQDHHQHPQVSNFSAVQTKEETWRNRFINRLNNYSMHTLPPLMWNTNISRRRRRRRPPSTQTLAAFPKDKQDQIMRSQCLSKAHKILEEI